MIKQYNECSISREQMIEKISSQQTVIATYGKNKYISESKTVDYKELIGKHVVAFTYGYGDQYYLKEFIFAGIKEKYTFFNEQSQPRNDEEKEKLIRRYGYVVVDKEGNDTDIFTDCNTDNYLCCSDSNRQTHFLILN